MLSAQCNVELIFVNFHFINRNKALKVNSQVTMLSGQCNAELTGQCFSGLRAPRPVRHRVPGVGPQQGGFRLHGVREGDRLD